MVDAPLGVGNEDEKKRVFFFFFRGQRTEKENCWVFLPRLIEARKVAEMISEEASESLCDRGLPH